MDGMIFQTAAGCLGTIDAPLTSSWGGHGGFSCCSCVNPVVQEPTFPPLTCQDFVERSDLHWPSVCLGILFGLLLAQLMDLLGLFRQYLTTTCKTLG